MHAAGQSTMPGITSAARPPEIPDHELGCLIGRGAYGEVWLARNAIGTMRAVKIVHRQSFQHAEHFEREFKGLLKFEPISRSHNGLVNILQIGRRDEAGYFFYVMELADDGVAADVRRLTSSNSQPSTVSTQPESQSLLTSVATYSPKTLRSGLQVQGRLPPAECIVLGLKLTAALDYLHAHGLVHRDIKPSNIIFVAGEPKLADIGLVTAIDEAHSLVGTVGYIPPEGPGTPQADLYSLGKVLYEIAFGKERQEFPQLPADLQSHPDYAVLLELNEVILKACETDPHRRYASATALGADLARLQQGRSVKRRHTAERRWGFVKKCGLVAAAALVLAGVWLLANRFDAVKNHRPDARSSPPAAPVALKSVAVLPFDNESPDKADEYLGTQLAEEWSSTLTKIPELRVLGRESAASLKKSKDRRTVSRQLQVDATLEGRVRKSGNRLQLTAQLVNPADSFLLWSETYDREMSEIFGIQTDVAEKVAGKLTLKLTETVRARLATKPTKNLEAYQLYLEGRYHAKSYQQAIERFQGAIRLDPGFAAAYAGLADRYTMETTESASGRQFFPMALDNARKAVALAPRLSEAHTALARVKCLYEYDWDGAEKEIQLAVSLAPADAKAHQFYAHYLSIFRRFDQAIARAKLAKELDPLSAPIRDTLAWNLFDARRYGQALEEFKALLELNEGSALDGIGWCYVAQGKYDEAIPAFAKAERIWGLSPEKGAELLQAYQQGGMRGYWLKHVEQAKEKSNPLNMSPYWVAADYAMLGEYDQAFDWLEKAYEDRTYYMPWVGVEYRFYKLHSDPRFAALLKKMGLKLPAWKK